MKEKIAAAATDKKELLQGFKILGLFPFYVKLVSVKTHVKLCVIKEKIQDLKKDKPKNSDFYNAELQSKLIPLINKYIATALINSRPLGFLFKPFMKHKINECSHSEILHLYKKILELDEPAFFLAYWKHLMTQDHTLLKEVEHS